MDKFIQFKIYNYILLFVNNLSKCIAEPIAISVVWSVLVASQASHLLHYSNPHLSTSTLPATLNPPPPPNTIKR